MGRKTQPQSLGANNRSPQRCELGNYDPVAPAARQLQACSSQESLPPSNSSVIPHCYNKGMQTDTYHARLRAQQAEWRLLKGDERTERATRAAARSARRWADSDAQPDQQRRAGRLELIHCGVELDDGVASIDGDNDRIGEKGDPSPLTLAPGQKMAPELTSALKLSSVPQSESGPESDAGSASSPGPSRVHEQTQLPLDAG